MILTTTVAPLAILLWLGWKLLEQDRMLEAQQAQQRIELTADLLVAALQRALLSSEQRLAEGAEEWPEGAATVLFRGATVEVYPSGRIAWLPETSALPEAAPDAFAAGENYEFRLHDRASAVRVYRRLASSGDASVRAGALLRMGRNLAAMGQSAEALAAYASLDRYDDVAVGGLPGGLNARYARCKLLERQERRQELRDEAQLLTADLAAGRWKLGAAAYWLYASDAAAWGESRPPGDSDPEIFAAAVEDLWRKRPSLAATGRETLSVGSHTVTALWLKDGDALRILLAAPEFAHREWLPALKNLAGERRASFALRDAEGHNIFGADADRANPNATRSGYTASLPWDVEVTSLDAPGQDSAFAVRRKLLIAGFLLLVLMLLAASYMMFRAVGRELAVARLQSDFVAAVSHEFRTPLTSLRQFTEMLRENAGLSEERRRICYEAQSRAADRLARLVESLLDLGRMEAGARIYNLERRDCLDLVRGIVDDFQAEAQAAGFEVRLEASRDAVIEADGEALSRALWNLLDNAVKYSPGGAAVDVAVACEDGKVRITVSDRGLGIPPAERQRVFAKFQRGEQARTLGIRGTGIGLAMVDEIVRAHHGELEVESELGKGSAFTIVLPEKV